MIACRLQVPQGDLNPTNYPTAQYFLEQQVITPDETSQATRNNNASYKSVTRGSCTPCGVPSCDATCDGMYQLTVGSSTYCQEPAIQAWKKADSSVVETAIDVSGEGRFILAAKATAIDAEPGWWTYEYALYNLNSDRSAGGFRVALPSDLFLSDVRFPNNPADAFHDIDYHSGDGYVCEDCECFGGTTPGLACNTSADCAGGGVCKEHCAGGSNHGGLCNSGSECPGGVCRAHRLDFDGTDWQSSKDEQPRQVRWTMFATAVPENGNALRWGTLYNFRFEAKRAPHCTESVTIDLFKTAPENVTGHSVAPMPLQDPATLPPVIVWNSDPQSSDRTTRSLRFTVDAAPTAPGSTEQSAIKVTMMDLQHPVPPNLPAQAPPNFSVFESATCTAAGETNGCARWVGKPGTILESQDSPGFGNYRAARLQCTPFYFNWVAETNPGGVQSLINVVGAEIAPSSQYSVEAYSATCMGIEGSCTNVSCAVTMYTRRFGDTAPNFNPPATSTQPDAMDVAAVVNKLKNLPGALPKAITQVQPNLPELNADINALDVVAVVDAVRQEKYAFSGPCPCPSLMTRASTPCVTDMVCTEVPVDSGGGPGAKCVKTCVGGANDGDACINNSHCPGVGAVCGNTGVNPGYCRDRCGRCTPPL